MSGGKLPPDTKEPHSSYLALCRCRQPTTSEPNSSIDQLGADDVGACSRMGPVERAQIVSSNLSLTLSVRGCGLASLYKSPIFFN